MTAQKPEADTSGDEAPSTPVTEEPPPWWHRWWVVVIALVCVAYTFGHVVLVDLGFHGQTDRGYLSCMDSERLYNQTHSGTLTHIRAWITGELFCNDDEEHR